MLKAKVSKGGMRMTKVANKQHYFGLINSPKEQLNFKER